MGWATDLHDASFRGVQFECTSVNDAYKKALAIHQAPYSDDAEIEDMGIDPRKISIQAIYAGDDYLSWLDALEAALAETGSGELIHPVYGILEVQVDSWQVQHDAENMDACAISIEFVKAKAVKRELFIPTVAPTFIDYTDILNNPLSALDKFLKKLEKYYPTNFINAIANIRDGVQKAYKLVTGVKKKLNNFLSPRDWMFGFVDDVRRLVTFNVKDISAISKWRNLSKSVKRLGHVFDKNDANHSPALRQAWRATVIATQVAIVQEVVKRTREEMAKPVAAVVQDYAASADKQQLSLSGGFVAVSSSVGTASVNSIVQDASPTVISLTPLDLAVIRQVVRQDLQQAITDERSIPTLEVEQAQLEPVLQIAVYKKIADQVHLVIQEFIETRPPIMTTIIHQPSTLHILAHELYGDFSRAGEILRLNPNLENPALLRTGQELVVYAR